MRKGQIDKIRAVYEDHKTALFSYALSVTGNRCDAEDTVQAAILRVLRRTFLPHDIRAYLFRCIHNIAIDRWRKHQHCSSDELPELCDNRQKPLDSLLQERIWQSLNKRSSDEREVILLRTFDGMTFRQIASVRRQSINTIASFYRRGIAKMKQDFNEEML